MNDNWKQVRLGEIFHQSSKRLGPHDVEPEILSLSKYEGFVKSSEYFDRRVASSKLDNYKVVELGEFAYSTIHIDEGSIALNSLGSRGVISPMYTTMRLTDASVLDRYVALLLRSPSMLATYKRWAAGTVNRRRSLPFKTFAQIEVELPPLAEQRRIVDLIDSSDQVIKNAHSLVLAIREALSVLLSDWSGSHHGPMCRLGDVADMGSGPSWKASDERLSAARRPPGPGITNTPSGDTLDLTAPSTSAAARHDSRLRPGSLS